jgi:hypothetical protein
MSSSAQMSWSSWEFDRAERAGETDIGGFLL